MLDNMSDGRLIAGFAPGSGPGDLQLRRSLGAIARAVLGGGRAHSARLDAGRPVRLRRPALSAALRQSVAAPHAAAASADLDPGLALDRDPGQDRPARLLLLPLLAQPWQGNGEIAAAVRQDAGGARRPLRAVPHGHPAVGLCGRDRCAGAGRGEGRRVVLPQELPQGPPAARGPPTHRRAGHSLHPARGVPQLSEILRSRPRRCWAMPRTGTIWSARNRSSSAARTPSIAASWTSSRMPSRAIS